MPATPAMDRYPCMQSEHRHGRSGRSYPRKHSTRSATFDYDQAAFDEEHERTRRVMFTVGVHTVEGRCALDWYILTHDACPEKTITG